VQLQRPRVAGLGDELVHPGHCGLVVLHRGETRPPDQSVQRVVPVRLGERQLMLLAVEVVAAVDDPVGQGARMAPR
jgi:hypothetical protein